MKIEGRTRSVLVLPERVANSSAKFPPDAAALAEMKDVGRRGLASFFRINVSTKEPDEIEPAPLPTGTTFVWRLPMKSGGLVENFGARVDGSKILKLSRWLDIDFPDPNAFEPPGRYVIAPIVIVILALTLFFWRKVYREKRSSQNLIVAVLVGLCAAAVQSFSEEVSVPSEAPLKFIPPAASFCVGMLLSYATLNVIVYYLRRRLPIQVSNYLAFWRQGLPARTAGLELLRGVFAAMIFSCAWMTLMSLAGLWGKAIVDPGFRTRE